MALRAAARGPLSPSITSSKQLFKSHPGLSFSKNAYRAAALPPPGLAVEVSTLFSVHPIWIPACWGVLGMSLHLWALALICTQKSKQETPDS